uniref:Oxytocin n=1 Tax=Callorhinchus milii TaxID=7868 RepID=A0A4W3IL47_CALMI
MHSACLALCLLCLVPFTMACYIQNCPLGGKRSIMDTQMRQCLPCGPDDRGRCFGPRICCGRDIGCYVGTAETLGCRGENYLPSPCEPAGRPCGSERGKCASPGICCDDGESICPHSPALARKDLKATEGVNSRFTQLIPGDEGSLTMHLVGERGSQFAHRKVLQILSHQFYLGDCWPVHRKQKLPSLIE